MHKKLGLTVNNHNKNYLQKQKKQRGLGCVCFGLIVNKTQFTNLQSVLAVMANNFFNASKCMTGHLQVRHITQHIHLKPL